MTNQTPKIAKGITQDMLVSVYKPIGTGENSEVFAGTIADLSSALNPSGTFEPVFSDELNCTPSALRVLYSKSGIVVTASYYISVSFDPSFTSGSFSVSIPVSSSFENPRDAFGVTTPITDLYSELVSSIISANTDENKLNFEIEIATAGGSISIVTNIQYFVL